MGEDTMFDVDAEREAQRKRLENPGMGTRTVEDALSRAIDALEVAERQNERLRSECRAIAKDRDAERELRRDLQMATGATA